jgi:hypothetical protein
MQSNSHIRITSHGCGAVFRRWINGGIQMLAMQYTSRGRTQWRFPYGRGATDESPLRTLTRQMANEVAKDQLNFAVNVIVREPVYAELRPDERNHGGNHAKIFFLAEIASGEPRTCERLDRGPKPWLDETLGAPQWIEVTELVDLMRRTGTPIAHLNAALFALRTMAQFDEVVWSRYETTLDRESALFKQDTSAIEIVSRYRGVFHQSGRSSRRNWQPQTVR